MSLDTSPPSEGLSYRIAWVVQGTERYGVARMVESLLEAMAARGHRPVLISLGDGPFARRMAAEGVRVVQLDVGQAPRLAGGLPQKVMAVGRLEAFARRARRALRRALVVEGAQVAHFLWPHLVTIVGPAARAAGAVAVWEVPNTLSTSIPLGLNRRWYQRHSRRWGVTILAISAYSAKSLLPGPVEPVVVHLGVDAERFDPDRVDAVPRESVGVPDGAVLLGVVARLGESKGQDRVLAAMLDLVREGHDLHLLLLGGPEDGPFADRLRRSAAEAGQAGRLHLAGLVDGPERYYPIVDVGINARIDAEPYGLSVVEAMMMGVPMLVHALGGPAETVTDGETGWHVHDPSTASFTAGLRRALGDRQSWPERGAAARQRALEHFSLSEQASRYENILRLRLDSPPPHPASVTGSAAASRERR